MLGALSTVSIDQNTDFMAMVLAVARAGGLRLGRGAGPSIAAAGPQVGPENPPSVPVISRLYPPILRVEWASRARLEA
jgi:hypothetical protein